MRGPGSHNACFERPDTVMLALKGLLKLLGAREIT